VLRIMLLLLLLLLLLQVLQQISGAFKPDMGAVIARSSANVEDLAGMSGGWGWVGNWAGALCACVQCTQCGGL
jgi:hypothetical protein